ncbi:hypothetical protein THOM_1279 [Trachipleistophora hominis]|uniref:Uncharacterized protein n=1 Tax=Trachipleistophora hominis TaxID=72359 RepID=L7JXI3_TRAHO|nr:hypothetical protein THOM_1279 [Trachipleistophora hominis]
MKKNMVNGKETLGTMILPEGIFRKKEDYVDVQHYLRDLQRIFGEIEKMYVSSKNMIGVQKIFYYCGEVVCLKNHYVHLFMFTLLLNVLLLHYRLFIFHKRNQLKRGKNLCC